MFKLQRLLSIDTRSLALVRISLAGLVLIDLFQRAADLQAHYSDFGVLPTWATKFILQYQPSHWSLHLLTPKLYWLSGSLFWQSLLFGLAALAAACMLFGLRTRWATIITWILLASLHTRHPLVLNGGDHLLRMLLFWSMFLPLGEQFSLDRKRPGHSKEPRMTFSAATIAMMAQLCLLYWVSAATKTDPQWTESGWALYYALQLDQISTGFAKWIVQSPGVLQWMTFATLYLEWLGPLLIFIPRWTSRIRLIVIGLFVAFHVGIALCMHLGLFPWICISGWFVFLPTSFWDWLNAKFDFGSSAYRSEDRTRDQVAALRGRKSDLPPIINALVGGLLLYVVLFNLQVVFEVAKSEKMAWFNTTWKSVGYGLGLEQRFDLFAPKPTIIDGWLIAVATLKNGDQVDLIEEGRPVRWNKPELLAARYRNGHWGAYMFFLKEPTIAAAAHRPYYVEYLKRRYRAQQKNENDIDHVELYLMLEITPPFPEQPRAQKTLLYRDKPRLDVENYFQSPGEFD
ncbi:MAG: HTTM domain-containing protein [Planctomycetota bacterium]|nr:HTTM domain-containing protein [Planctomycetota bacterium]